MTSLRLLYSHLKLLSNKDLAETRSESGFKWEFPILFGEEVDIFTTSMFDNMNQLEKQVATEEFHETESNAAFRVLKK